MNYGTKHCSGYLHSSQFSPFRLLVVVHEHFIDSFAVRKTREIYLLSKDIPKQTNADSACSVGSWQTATGVLSTNCLLPSVGSARIGLKCHIVQRIVEELWWSTDSCKLHHMFLSTTDLIYTHTLTCHLSFLQCSTPCCYVRQLHGREYAEEVSWSRSISSFCNEMKYYWKHTSEPVAHSCVKSRISSWTDILRVITHDRVEGLVGLQVFASDGEQQVFRFTQTEQASRAGHRWHCPPIASNTVQLDRTK